MPPFRLAEQTWIDFGVLHPGPVLKDNMRRGGERLVVIKQVMCEFYVQ